MSATVGGRCRHGYRCVRVPVPGAGWVCQRHAVLALEPQSVHTQAHHVIQFTLGTGGGGGGWGGGAREADYLRLLREVIRTQGSSSWNISPTSCRWEGFRTEEQFPGRDSNPLKQLRTQERVNFEPYSDFNHWLRALSVRVLGAGFSGPPSDCPGPLTCPSTPTSFHFWAAPAPPSWWRHLPGPGGGADPGILASPLTPAAWLPDRW